MKTLLYKFSTQQLVLALSIGFSLLLLLFRIKFTHSFFYLFLVWNLFLATVPYAISWSLKEHYWERLRLPLKIIGFAAWLLFLPNSPYIITDLVHLHNKNSHLMWYDLFMVFAFALNGLILGLLSMLHMFDLLAQQYSQSVGVSIMAKVSLLCGYGIYLGRFLRFNSWDLFTKPQRIFLKMMETIYDPHLWMMTFAFGGLLWILFLLMRSMRGELNR